MAWLTTFEPQRPSCCLGCPSSLVRVPNEKRKRKMYWDVLSNQDVCICLQCLVVLSVCVRLSVCCLTLYWTPCKSHKPEQTMSCIQLFAHPTPCITSVAYCCSNLCCKPRLQAFVASLCCYLAYQVSLHASVDGNEGWRHNLLLLCLQCQGWRYGDYFKHAYILVSPLTSHKCFIRILFCWTSCCKEILVEWGEEFVLCKYPLWIMLVVLVVSLDILLLMMHGHEWMYTLLLPWYYQW